MPNRPWSAVAHTAESRGGAADAVIGIPCLLTGGTEVQTLALGKTLVRMGVSVRVVCYHESEPAVVQLFRCAGVPTDLLGVERSAGLVTVAARLRAYLVRWRPRVVHIQYVAPGAAAVLAARLAGVPTVLATVHQPWHPGLGRLPRLLLKASAFLCQGVTAVSLSALRSWFGPRAAAEGAAVADADPRPSPAGSNARRARRSGWSVLYNAVDVAAIAGIGCSTDRSETRRRWGLGDGPTIGMFGRLTQGKGLDVLLSAHEIVRATMPDVQLLLTGPTGGADKVGEGRGLAPRWVTGTGAGQRWVGGLSWTDTIRLMSVVDVVAVPSRYEGFGLAAAEALACGVPVVASRTGGLQEVVQDGRTGILCPVADAEAFAHALISMLRNAVRRAEMGKAGKADVAERFGVARYENAVRMLYGL